LIESLLNVDVLIRPQLVDATAKKIRELRHELDNPNRNPSPVPAPSPQTNSPHIRARASIDRQSSRRFAMMNTDKLSPSGEMSVLGRLSPSQMELK
jgi:hypothetical protein